MTALRPERDSSPYGGEAAYGGADAFEAGALQAEAFQAEALQAQAEVLQAEAFQAAIEGLSDPLTDPLPGASGPQAASEPLAPAEPQRERYGAQGTQDVPAAPGYGDDRSARQTYGERQQETYEARPQPYEAYKTFGGAAQQAYETPGHEHPVVDDVVAYDVVAYEPPTADEETMALRVVEARRTAEVVGESPSEGAASAPAPGGRAARRKAANRKAAKRHWWRGGGVGGAHGAHGGAGTAAGIRGIRGTRGTRGARRGAQETGEAAKAEGAEGAEGVEGKPLTVPRSRVEARRAARANKPGTGIIASQVIGEMFITTGVLMLLFVTYQLWWSNIRAQQQAGKETSDLQQEWASGKRAPGAFEPGQGFAILHIPKLDVVVPIAEGISKSKVLDHGMVGHYDANSIKTAMPGDKTGNFGIAGHRNTHGEPFRYINRLKPGDPIVVETQDKYYIYDMASLLPVTSPSNVSVLDPIPKQAGFTKAGRYLTLTTCTPEFTSKYRMIVWGKMVDERPRGEGKPDALVQ